MHGDPAGLQRIDKLFHIDIYTTTFTGNPLPWGAWPSLHSGFASYSAVFLSYLYPKFTPLFFLYVAWIWWATMYLGHHYLVDLIGGFIYALICAIGSIVYLQIKKPYHKDYAELKTIMIQEYDYGLLTDEYKIDHKNQIKKSYEPLADSQKKLLTAGSSTMINESISINERGSDVYEVNGSSMITETNNNTFLSPNDPALDKLSVISNVEKDSSMIDTNDITNAKYI